MTPDEARRELGLALTRARRARTKTTGGFGDQFDPGLVVMITEEVALALLADGKHRAIPMPVDTYKPGPVGVCAKCGAALKDWTVHLRWWQR
jgi:hypothetical protein